MKYHPRWFEIDIRLTNALFFLMHWSASRERFVDRVYLRYLSWRGKTVWLNANKEPLFGQLWLTMLVWQFYEIAYALHLSPINYPLHLQSYIWNDVKEVGRDAE